MNLTHLLKLLEHEKNSLNKVISKMSFLIIIDFGGNL